MSTVELNRFANYNPFTQAQSMSQTINKHTPQPMNQPVSQSIPEQETAPKQINDGYYEHASEYLFRDKKNYFRRFTDFIITKITKIIKFELNDTQTEFFILNLRCENGFEEDVAIPVDKFSDLPKVIEKNSHQFLIFVDRYPRANEFFKRVSKEILRRELNSGRVQVKYVYSRWGVGATRC